MRSDTAGKTAHADKHTNQRSPLTLRRGSACFLLLLSEEEQEEGGKKFTTSFSYIRVGADPLIQPWEGDRRTGLEKPN